ncbi:MAG: pyruvate dehydrogenase (acetyl-transferring) E1 component subunit alpha [Bacteroidia bacterium]
MATTKSKASSAKKTTTRRRSSKKPAYSKDQILEWFRSMLLQRRFEEKAGQLYMERKIRGFCHLYIGQEAVSTGLEAAIRPDDVVITAYRDHGLGLARGMTSNECMAELYGKATGSSKGKGGSMHYFDKENNFAGGHGIVGAQIPVGAGIAFGMKYKEEDRICACLMGDGAVRQGALHEAFNMAMTWKLPVLYIIENNGYAMGTSVERTSNVTDLYRLGESYDMPGKAIDAMDMIKTMEELKEAVDHVRSGKGPYLIEMKTYRYRGHSMSDPMKYRTREELEQFRDRDPIVGVKHYAEKYKMGLDDEFQRIEEEIKAEVAASVEHAETAPFPNAEKEMYEDVYIGDYPFSSDF